MIGHEDKVLTFKSFIIRDTMASWTMGRIAAYRGAHRLMQQGLIKPDLFFNKNYFRERIRDDAKYLVRLYRDYLKSKNK